MTLVPVLYLCCCFQVLWASGLFCHLGLRALGNYFLVVLFLLICGPFWVLRAISAGKHRRKTQLVCREKGTSFARDPTTPGAERFSSFEQHNAKSGQRSQTEVGEELLVFGWNWGSLWKFTYLKLHVCSCREDWQSQPSRLILIRSHSKKDMASSWRSMVP